MEVKKVSEKFEIISKDFYSNCAVEAIRAKLQDWKHVSLTYVSPFNNEVCPHILWSDGKYDYDFGNEGKGDQGILNWTLHKGHIRKRPLGYNQKYKKICRRWSCKHRGMNWLILSNIKKKRR
jgi:hypothetical protein